MNRGQQYCTSCYRTAIQLPTRTILESCSTCHLIFHCNTCPSSHPEEACKTYAQFLQDEMFLIDTFEKSGKVSTQFPTNKPRTTCRALSSAGSWFEYFTEISDKNMIQVFVREDFTFIEEMAGRIPGMDPKQTESMWLALRQGSEVSAMPLTILAALEASFPDLSKMKKITLHIVGAAMEYVNIAIFEELLHLLPLLKELHMVLVGPAMSGALKPGDAAKDIVVRCCNACSAQGKKRTMGLYNGLYHEFVNSKHHDNVKPDLAVLFHSGRSQEDEESWAPTTQWLVESGTRTLCTTYNEEGLVEEVQELMEMGAKFLVEPGLNRWKGIPWRPDFVVDVEFAGHNNHSFWYVFEGTESVS